MLDLTERIHSEFKFLPGATKVGTPVADVLRMRKGVCQDFAHVQLGCLRSLGFAARYVSGYIVTTPPPGQARLQGADVSHAWVSVFAPDLGWIDFDPTNGLIPSDGHITVGWARDYDDIGPVRGVVVGGRRQHLDVSVDVAPVEYRLPALLGRGHNARAIKHLPGDNSHQKERLDGFRVVASLAQCMS